jgi:hypothetical protein
VIEVYKILSPEASSAIGANTVDTRAIPPLCFQMVAAADTLTPASPIFAITTVADFIASAEEAAGLSSEIVVDVGRSGDYIHAHGKKTEDRGDMHYLF